MKWKPVWVSLKGRAYPIYIGAGLLKHLPELLARHCAFRRPVQGRSSRVPWPNVLPYRPWRVVLVSDAFLMKRAGGRLARGLRARGWDVAHKALPRGEKAKSFATLTGLYDFLLKSRIERRTPLLAVGGGAVGDAAGFAAATYYRGIPLAQVPTTLLAQVDSSIGGKTAINHPLAKNAIGAFHQPLFAVCDVELLGTLPRREFLSGMAEVVKYALVFDLAFARWLAAHWNAILACRRADMIRMVRVCAAWKAGAVAQDERDLSGRRELLNFGHTVGHALEAAGGYRRFLHGEAVAWGMRFAVELSVGRGWMKNTNARELAGRLLGMLPAPSLAGLKDNAIFSALRRDKKMSSGGNVFVLLRDLGKPVRVGDVSVEEMRGAWTRARGKP